MAITQDFLTPEQFADVQKAEQSVANLTAPQNAVPESRNIPAEAIGTQAITLPQAQPSQAPSFENLAQQELATMQQAEQVTQKGDQLSLDTANLISRLSGQEEALTEAEKQTGVLDFRKQLQGLNNAILQKQAEIAQDDVRLIAGLQDIEDKAIPMEFITGQQASVQQKANIARALKMSEIGVLNAQVLAAQGNVALAQETAQRAVDAKYAPIKEAISINQAQLEAISPILDREEKKRAAAQQNRYNLQLQQIEDAKAEQKRNIDLAMNYAETASKYGQGQLASQFSALDPNSPTFKADVSKLISQVKDPRLALDIAYQTAQINKINREALAFENAKKEATTKAIEIAKQKELTAQNTVISTQEKLDLLNGAINSGAIDTTVGTTALARGLFQTGAILDKVTGAKQNLISAINQITAQQFLKSITDLKAQGGTLGALSEKEGEILSRAATQFDSWAIKDSDGNVTGYDTTESAFKDELNRVKSAYERVQTAAKKDAGLLLDENEQSLLDTAFAEINFDPSILY